MRKKTLEQLNQYIEEFKTIFYQKIESDSSFLTVEKYRIKLNNGSNIYREKMLKNKQDGSASIILPVTETGEIILAVEPRVFTKKTVDVGVPAGYIEVDEDPKEAARRELLEETGYQAESFLYLGSYYQDQGCSAAYNHYFLGINCKKVGNQNLDSGEFIKYLIVNFEELEELIKEHYITGLNSIYAIEKGKTYLKER